MSLTSGCYYDNFQELHPLLNMGCDSSAATYSNQVSKIVSTYCIGCHNGAGAGGSIQLNSYENVRAQASTGMLMNALTGNGVPSMPLNTHLDACSIGSIKQWIQNGMPNN